MDDRFCSFNRSFISKITECCLLFFPQTWTQNHDFSIWQNCGLKHRCKAKKSNSPKLPSFRNVSVSVNFITQVIFIFLLFVGMVMHANEFLKKENKKFTEIKN